MQWRNTETPSFSGTPRTGGAPSIVETLELIDRDGAVVGSFNKDSAGALSFDMAGAVTQSGPVAYKSSDTSRNEDNVPAQIETATIVGGPIVTEAQIVVTANGMANSPKTVKFTVASGDTASQVATKARAALTADADVSAFFTVSGATTAIILTAITEAANDATMNMASDNDSCGGLTPAASSANTTAGVAPVLQVETATVVGTIVTGVFQVETATIVEDVPGTLGAGDATVTVTAAGMTNSPKAVVVALAENDTEAQVAGKIATALGLDADISAWFVVTNPGGAPTTVVLTRTAAAADDATMNIAYADTTSSGLTDDATSVHTTAGVASGAGNAEVIVTAAGMTNSPKTVNVAVADGDNASTIAGKIRSALTADANVGHVTTGFFTVSGATDQIILTAKADAANDATMNISVDNGTCTGITPDLTSDNTTAGVLGVLQVETATITGTIVTQMETVITAAGMTGSPKTVLVTVASGDTAAQVAGKVRAALIVDADVGHPTTGWFTVTGSGAEIILTVNEDTDYDATMNLASDNDTCAGLTPTATSANTTSLIIDPALSVDLVPGTYLIEAQIPITTQDGGFKCDLAGGTVGVDNVFAQYTLFDDVGTAYGTARSSTLAGAGSQIAAADDSNYMLQITGSVEVSTAGTLGFRWAALIPDSTDTTVSRGAWLKATKV